MKTVLIILLGNRDLQIPVTASVSLTYRDRLLQNNDDKQFYTINKTQQASFLETSEMIWNDYESFEKVIIFPMISQTLEYIKNLGNSIDKVLFCTSKQNPLDGQDCHYVAEFANRYFSERGYNTEYLPFACNPTNFTELLDFFLSITNQHKEDKLYFGNSGGTADMKAASYFSGVFKNIEFITINARTKQASQNNFKKQEQAILKHIIENMLDVYDYEGILKLPVHNVIKNECKKALDWYNLNTDLIDNQPNYESQATKSIEFMYNNMVVCFSQGRYADVIGRMFRIEEAIGQLLYYRDLKNKGLIDNNDKVKRIDSSGKEKFDSKFQKVISHKGIDPFIQFYPELVYQNEKNEYFFSKYPTVSLNSGKNFFYFFSKSLNINQEIYNLWSKPNKNYPSPNSPDNEGSMGSLRNKSILGHGFKGVSKQDIEIIIGDFYLFCTELKTLLHQKLLITINPIFDQLNQKIKELL